MRRTSSMCSRGVTLLEVSVWIGVFVVTMSAIVTTLLYFYRTNTYTIDQGSAVISAQRGMDKMVRIIREAAYASDGAYPVVSLAANQFSFYADVDSDAQVEKLRYFVQGTSLIEGVINPTGDPPVYTGAEVTSTLSDYVHNLDQGVTTFAYKDKNGTAITDYSKIADVRFVEVNVVVNVDPVRLPNQITLRSSAALRNLK